MNHHMTHNSGNLPFVLLKENDYMLRQTFSLHAKESGMADVIQASSHAVAQEKCANTPFNLIILSFNEWEEDLSLVFTIRSNLTACAEDTPIVGIVPQITAANLQELKALNVTDILVKPLRIRNMQEAFMRNFHH